MRKNAPGEYFHIYNRGTQKQLIFNDDNDRIRLLFLILTFQGNFKIKKINRIAKPSGQHSMLAIDPSLVSDIVKDRTVELINFIFMPNHFHLTIRELKNGGMAKYMQRVLNAYTKYFNARHDKSGHLFQGSYKSVHIETDEQLIYLSFYIHRNCNELKEWNNDIERYPWSSYQDYVGINRWGTLLVTDSILLRYQNHQEYKKFIDSSTTKNGKKKPK